MSGRATPMVLCFSFFLLLVLPSRGEGCGAAYTDACYVNCTVFDFVDPANACFLNCSAYPAYADPSSPCYVCDPLINCYPIGGVCGADATQPCACNYGFTNDNCSAFIVAEDDPAYQFLVWFLGVGCMSALGAFSFGLLIFQLVHVDSFQARHFFVLRNLSILSTALCFCACMFGFFYFVPDAYARSGIRIGCSIWIMDFFCAYFTAMAFCCVTWQWIVVVRSISTTRSVFVYVRSVLRGLQFYLVFVAVALLLTSIASSVLSCVCDGINCAYDAQDYVYWVSWLVLNGIAILICMVNAIVVIAALQRYEMRHRRKIRLFTVFIIGAGCGMLMLVGFGISFFVSYATTREGFLSAECLFQAFVDVIILAILLLLTFTRQLSSVDDSRSPRKSTLQSSDPREEPSGVAQPKRSLDDLPTDEAESTPHSDTGEGDLQTGIIIL
jgi:hypothetical protein